MSALSKYELECVERLERRAAHLEKRVTEPDRVGISHDRKELKALRTVLQIVRDLEFVEPLESTG